MKRVLFVDLAPRPGGSIVSLQLLVQGLPADTWRPLAVILNAANPAVDQFRALAVLEQGVWPVDSRQGMGDAYPEIVEEARRGPLIARLKQWPGFTAVWQSAGMLARLARDILPLAWQLRGLMRRLQPDLVHLNDIIPVSRAGIIAAASLGIPIVCHVRALDPLTWLDRYLSRWVDGFIYISQAVAEQQRAAGATVRAAYVVLNGIDLAAFPLDLDGTGVRADLGIAPTTYLVGSVGRLVTWKGHHVVLRAFADFASHCPDAHLLIVGGPDVAEPGYDDYLLELALNLGVADHVTLTGHRVDVPQVMAALDVVCHAAIEPEPFGRVVIEGMAARRPVIGSAAGGVLEIIEPGSSGLVVPPGNSQALALAMTSLWQNPGVAASLAAAGRQRVEHCFTLGQYLHGVQAAYAAVIAQADRGGGDR